MSALYDDYYNVGSHDYNHYSFEISTGEYVTYNDCVKGNNSCRCYFDLYPINRSYDVRLLLFQSAYYYSVYTSKFRVVNGILLKENFEPFTPKEPCWIAPPAIAGVLNSPLNASFCCTKFGPSKTVKPITCNPFGTESPRTFAYVLINILKRIKN
uniref:Uncharacterized protein n=1 Tax=Panagrolaimus sp. ES5 TaxID=591445 RepID=A0AC34F5Y2_9BILA